MNGLLEVVGEVLLVIVIAVTSVVIYGEVRWPFVAAVFVGSNALLLVVALVVWARGSRGR